MGKKLAQTPEIKAAIAKATGGSVDPDSVSVFETQSYNTLPVNKKGSIFNGATTTESTLRQMADYLNNGGHVPLHTLHNQGGELPVGRLFQGIVHDASGVPQLNTQFYLPNNGQAQLIEALDTGTIEQVSVGVSFQHLNCSECGWDYLGTDATMANIWDQTCANDHTIGNNGVHLICSGLDQFLEQSLVSKGAARNANVVGRAKALMSGDRYTQLAATGRAPEATVLFASQTQPPEKRTEQTMDLTALVAQLSDSKAAHAVEAAAHKALQTAHTALQAAAADAKKVADEAHAKLTARVAELEAALKPEMKDVQAKLTAAEAEAKAALDYIRGEADRLAIACGVEKPAADAKLDALTGAISSSRTKLAESIPTGGVALQAANGSGKNPATATPPANAFSTNRA